MSTLYSTYFSPHNLQQFYPLQTLDSSIFVAHLYPSPRETLYRERERERGGGECYLRLRLTYKLSLTHFGWPFSYDPFTHLLEVIEIHCQTFICLLPEICKLSKITTKKRYTCKECFDLCYCRI